MLFLGFPIVRLSSCAWRLHTMLLVRGTYLPLGYTAMFYVFFALATHVCIRVANHSNATGVHGRSGGYVQHGSCCEQPFYACTEEPRADDLIVLSRNLGGSGWCARV